MISGLAKMSPEQLLQAADDALLKSREAEVEKLEVLLAWGDAFSGDPQDEPNAVPVRYGGPRLITLGGEGTPQMSDLALVEIAVARRESVFTTRRRTADAFDLRHRLPLVWAGLQELRCETWVGTKVAAMSRKLTLTQVALVDVAVAEALDESPARILEIAEAKIIEADPVAHQERIKANRARKGVWCSRPKTGESVEGETAGVGSVFARIDEADLEAHREFIEELAQALAAHAGPPAEGEEPPSMDHWRAEAFAMLADPAAVLAFLRGETDQPVDEPTDESDQPAEAPAPEATAEPATSPTAGPSATVVVHVAQDPDTGALGPVARVEGLGPRLLSQVRDLLRRHAEVTVTPVIDLHTGLRTPHRRQDPHRAPHPGRRVPPRHRPLHQDRPSTRPRPHDAVWQARPTRADRGSQRHPTAATSPPGQDPRRLHGSPARTRPLDLAYTPRPAPPRHHQWHHVDHPR
ncbi:hypothetical protein ASD84_21545 [Nocardioides sp. Root682]|uniref:hypothetical protein n=1 Tax=Nocardioides sp. Root682 TaxID=1736586 RepID=UPI0007018414|nr:hypothetical protein [Nocardioides sp. Root682]KRA86789.1 hypothetical protein ASD84_21545 [Nocardioides sp. Root682]